MAERLNGKIQEMLVEGIEHSKILEMLYYSFVIDIKIMVEPSE